MFSRGDVSREKDVGSPRELFRIHCAADEKFFVRQTTSRLDEELGQCGLTIFGIRAEIRQVASILFGSRNRMVRFRVNAAIQGSNDLSAQLRSQFVQRAATGVTEH